MLYKKRGDSSSIKDILAKLNGVTSVYVPVVYSSSDIKSAKNILDRLLSQSNRSEVSYEKVVPDEVGET